jgi:hypothetical protein
MTFGQVFQFFVNFYALTILFMKAAILLEWMRIFAPNGSRGAFYVGQHTSGPIPSTYIPK